MSSLIGSGNAGGLIEFLDQLVEKGRVTSGAVNPLKSASRQIISSVDGEDRWVDVDIRTLDIADYIERFKNLTMGKYTADSYKSYQSRLTKAKEWYSTFLVNPGWIPPKTSVARLSKQSTYKISGSSSKLNNVEENIVNDNGDIEKNKQSSSQGDLIAYPFPLLTGKIVNLYLPIDLKLSDAKRIGRFVESLSIDNVGEV